MSRDSAVNIETGYGLDSQGVGVRFWVGARLLPLSKSSRLVLWPIQPPIQWLLGALSMGVKQPGREADHPPPTCAEVRNTWIYTSTPPHVFMA
jgi:hypothetical protein